LPFRFWGVEDEVGGKLWGVEVGGVNSFIFLVGAGKSD
jgi:hypothetical protein